MDNLPNTWEDWIANFTEWQDRVGFNRDWMGDFDLQYNLIGTVLAMSSSLVITRAVQNGNALFKFHIRACVMLW
ncbi:MAG: hypothetical protein GWP25_04790 [Euryarchaeota archaeon]|nr:hypothetical protein [Euryarchaeota archaeon]